MKCPISQMTKVTLVRLFGPHIFFLSEEPLDSPEVITSVIISGEKKKMPMEMTPNLFICNEKLNATGIFLCVYHYYYMWLHAIVCTYINLFDCRAARGYY